MPAERRAVDQTLTRHAKLRYLREDKRDQDVYTLVLSGYQFGWTKISRGTSYRALDDSILAKIARQVNLQLNELKAAIACTVNWPEYVAILKRKFPADADKVPGA